jgi:hypothetical protein
MAVAIQEALIVILRSESGLVRGLLVDGDRKW